MIGRGARGRASACQIRPSGNATIVPETPHPVGAAKDLAHEAERGRSARTPLIAITGVTLVVAIVVAVILTVSLLVYFLA